jgi:glycosyltransferase involved in cell wall biosynthesis
VPRRLLLVLTLPARGGAEEYALRIARAATAQGWDVHVALPFDPGTESLRQDLRAAGSELSAIAGVDGIGGNSWTTRAPASLHASLSFARAVLRSRPDVVHITLPWPTNALPQLLTSAVLGLPTLVVFQLVAGGPALGPRRRLAYRWMRSRHQRWIAVSHHGREVLSALYGMEPGAIGVIYNGAPVARPECDGPSAGARAEVRAELGLPSDAAVLLSVGRLDRQKGHADLLCALAGVHSARPDVRLVIAGEGPERERLEELLDALGLAHAVRLLGHRGDVERLMAGADLFVFPSYFEGTPFAMIEAMAHGLPIISSTFGGVDEIVDHGGNAVLVPVGRPDALRRAIVEVLADRPARERLAAAGRERAAQFTERAMVAATMHELERLRAS